MQIQNTYILGSGVWGGSSRTGRKESRSGVSFERKNTGRRKKGKITVRRSISAASYMMRMAQAKTPSQVAAIIRTARADLQFVKSCNSDDAEVEKAKRIIKRVISKGQLKISRLKEEQEMERQQELLDDAGKKEMVQELKKKRRSRKAQEAADTCDTERATVVKEQDCNQAAVMISSGMDSAIGSIGNIGSVASAGVECSGGSVDVVV